MTDRSREHLSSDEVRQIASEYLQELLLYYEQLQRNLAVATPIAAHGARFEQRVGELLSAMTQFTDPQERRAAVLQVLCRKEQRPATLPRGKA